MTLINSLENYLKNHTYPFNHWTIDKPLSEEAIDEIYKVKIPEGEVIFDGTRAGDKTGKDLLGKLRVYINRDNYMLKKCIFSLGSEKSRVKKKQTLRISEKADAEVKKALSFHFCRVRRPHKTHRNFSPSSGVLRTQNHRNFFQKNTCCSF